MAEEILLVYTTYPDTDTARGIIRTLVDEQLIACGNLFPVVESIYRWQGGVQVAGEVFGILKTTRSCLGALAARYRALHPYEVPELVTVSVEDGLPNYLSWIEQNCPPPPDWQG
jgi:periplasmic divalent cation tolerance protein